MRSALLLICSLLLFAGCSDEVVSTEEEASVPEFQNPILAGFYPDPTICQANGKFYLTTSTFAYFPGLPIFESEDLVNWELIGHAMDRPSQLDTEGSGVSRGLFAPGMTFHDGVFYITCTNVSGGGNYIITATDPAGPWSDPTYLPEVNGIDPSLFFDEDGSMYIVYNSIPPGDSSLYSGHRTIRLYEIDRETLSVTGEQTLLVNGGTDLSKEPVWIEAPHIYHINDYYYLMCAEGGTGPQHSEVIFRGNSARGPYEPWDQNPILTQRHLDPNRENPVSYAGHADMVELENGDWWAVFLAVRPYEGNYFNTGRDTWLAPVRWTDDGWPVINPDFEEVQYTYPTPLGNPVDTTGDRFSGNLAFTDEFEGDSLNMRYIFLRTPREKWYDLSDGALNLELRPETVSGRSNPSFVGHRQQNMTGEASVLLDFQPTADNESAGLVAFQNERRYFYIAKTISDGQPVIQFIKSVDSREGGTEVIESAPAPEGPVQLRISFDGADYALSFAGTEGNWQTLAEGLDGKYLSTDDAGGFVGVVLAPYATSDGQESDNTASFDWYRYAGDDAVYR